MWKVVNKIEHIAKGWFNYLAGRRNTLSNYRMKICGNCPHKHKLFKIVDVCTICGCFLKAKTKVTEEQCPIKKW